MMALDTFVINMSDLKRCYLIFRWERYDVYGIFGKRFNHIYLHSLWIMLYGVWCKCNE